MQAPIKQRVEKRLLFFFFFFLFPFLFFLAPPHFRQADTETSLSADGCDPSRGSRAAPDNASIAAERAGGEETEHHGRSAAAHKRIQREEEQGIVQKPLEPGPGPWQEKQLVGLTAAAGSKVSSSAG